jgi:hypothetical protein
MFAKNVKNVRVATLGGIRGYKEGEEVPEWRIG